LLYKGRNLQGRSREQRKKEEEERGGGRGPTEQIKNPKSKTNKPAIKQAERK
jgi:hypothetical protein